MKLRKIGYSLGFVASLVLVAGCTRESPEAMLASAKVLLERNDTRAAIVQLKSALQGNAGLAEARLLLAKSLLATGDVQGALIEVRKAQELGYPEEKTIPVLAESLLQQSNASKVVADYSKTQLPDPKEMAALQATLAMAFSDLGQGAESDARLALALKADPNGAYPRLVQAKLLTIKGQYAGALEVLSGFASGRQADTEALLLKARILQSSGASPKDVLAAYAEVFKRDPMNRQAHVGMIYLHLAQKDIAAAKASLGSLQKLYPKHPETLYFAVLLAFEGKDLKQANELMQQLLKLVPDDPRVLHLAGAIEFQTGGLLRAETYLAKALRLAPDFSSARLLLAQVHLRQGDGAKVLHVLQPALAAPELAPGVAAAAGEAYLLLGEHRRAEEYFEKAFQTDPSDQRSRTALALSKVKRGAEAQGIEELKTIAATDKGYSADLALISVYSRKKDYESAAAAITAFQAKSPQSGMAGILRARLELLRGRRDAARSAFESAIQVEPTNSLAVFALVSMDLQDKRDDAAMARLEALIKQDPSNLTAKLSLLDLQSRKGLAKDKMIERLLELVRQHPAEAAPRKALMALRIERKELKLALQVAQDGVAAAPRNPEMFEMLGQVQVLLGERLQAISAFNSMAALQPNSPNAHMRLAAVQAEMRDTDAAIQSLKRALEVRPDLVQAQVALAKQELLANRPVEARALVRGLQRQHPEDPKGYLLAGDLEASAKNWPEAAKAYRLGLERAANTELAVKLYRSLVNASQADEAAKVERQWLAAHPNDADFINALADDALTKMRVNDALPRYLQVLKLKPDNAPVANNIAWLLLRAKKPGALEYAERAVKLEPTQATFWDTLAEVLAAEGKLDKALEAQNKAVNLAPSIHTHRLHLAKYLLLAGDKPRAKKELRTLLELGDKFPGQREVKALLAET